MTGGPRPLPGQEQIYARVFGRGYGHDRSLAAGRPLNAVGAPLPAITYPALEFLRQLDLSTASVLALGAADSLAFWCRAARRVTARLDDAATRAAAASLGLDNLALAEPGAPADAEGADAEGAGASSTYDIVLIDGGDHAAAAIDALNRLAWGGMVVLHRAERHPAAAHHLRKGDLIEIDFTGFAPLERRPVTTAIFLHRAFDMTARAGHRPLPGVGAEPHQTSDRSDPRSPR